MDRTTRGRALLLAAAGIAILVVAVPALGADPSAGPGNSQGNGQGNGRGHGQGNGQAKERPDKGPEIAKEMRGVVAQTTDDKGRPSFTMTVDGTTWELSAGPKWFWGDDSPLKAHVGDTVTVAGTHHEGETELDVESVDGTTLREAGKPPWAGGPKVVGEDHPGYKAWKDEDADAQ